MSSARCGVELIEELLAMQVELMMEKTAILTRPFIGNLFPRQPQPGIENTRRKILHLLYIELAVMISYLIVQTIAFVFDHYGTGEIHASIVIELCMTVLLIIYVISFIVMLTEHFPTAMSTFSFLTLVHLLSAFVLFVLSIMALIVSLTLTDSVPLDIILDITYIVIALSIIGLSVSTYLALLNLRKLLAT